MIKWRIQKSVALDLYKSLGKDKLEELKAEVIAILKKHDSDEVKKAIEFFDKDEQKYTHLEKSLDGQWVEKAGYGVGTVRIWKGKKYKKVSTNPTRWVRVFDKHDHGAASAMGKYIAQVKRCSTPEELYQFCMKQRSLFQDDNGVDLPIMDKLRAAIDEQKNKVGDELDGSKHFDTNNITKRKDLGKILGEEEKGNSGKSEKDKYKKLQDELKEEIASGKRNNTKELKEDVSEWKNLLSIAEKHPGSYSKEQTAHFREIIRIGEEELKRREERKNKNDAYMKDDLAKLKAGNYSFDSFEDFKKEINKQAGDPKGDKQKNYIGYLKISNDDYLKKVYDAMSKDDSKVLSNGKTIKEVREKYGIKTDDNKAYKGKLATQKQIDEATKVAEKTELNREEMLKKPITRIQQYANSNVDDFDGGIDKFIEYKAEIQPEGVSMNEVGKEFARLINHNVARKIWADYENGALIINENGYFESKKDSDKDYKDDHYNVTDGERTSLLYKVRTAQDDIDSYQDKLAEIEKEGQKIASQKGDLSDSDAKKLIDLGKKRNMWQEKLKTRNADLMAAKQKLADHDEKIKREQAEKEEKDNESNKDSGKNYWIQDIRGNRLTNEDAKNRIKSNLSQIDAYNNLIADSDKADSIKWNSKKDQLENENKNLMDKMNPEDRKEMESEAEKHQNRSNAMKGNQNAKKWGLSDDDVEKMKIIKDKVEEKIAKENGNKRLSDYELKSKKEDILMNMSKRARDPDTKKLSLVLRSMDGKMPEEYLADTTKRLDEVVERSVKDAGNKANATAWEIQDMNHYWGAHIDENQAMCLTEFESLANILESSKGELDKDGKNAISNAIDLLNRQKEMYSHEYYHRDYIVQKPNDTKQDDLINRYTELAKKYGSDIPEPPKEEPKEEKKSSSTKRAEDYVSKYAGKEINSKPVEITKIVDDGERSGFYTFEFKSGNDTYKMTYDLGFGGKQDKPSIKKIGSSEPEPENKTSNVTMDKAIEKYATDKQIKNTINKISDEDFASEDENRMFMNGTYQDNGYKIATDGRILSMIKSDYPDSEEGKIKATTKALKQSDKNLNKLEKALASAQVNLEKAKETGTGSLTYRYAQENIIGIKNQIENVKKQKETGFIDGQFPNYKRVIPSMGHSNLEKLSGFENFNQILKVAKVAAAYKKSNGNCAVKVGDKIFEPNQLIKVLALAEKNGLKNVVTDKNRDNGPVEFNGDKGSIVMMPYTDNKRIFDAQTGKVIVADESDKSVENFLSSIGDKKSDIKKALFDLISLIDDEPGEEDSEKDGESVFFDKDELTDYSDNDASQPELFNSTQYKVADALNSVFGC